MSVRDQELAEAKKNGLLVDMGDASTKNTSPTSVVVGDQQLHGEMDELDHWDALRDSDDDFDLDDDSDDELL
jgi:hypothetical protein